MSRLGRDSKKEHKNATLRRIVETLQRTRLPYTLGRIKKEMKVDLTAKENYPVLNKLKDHSRVVVQGGKIFAYKPEIDNVNNLDQLRARISRTREGIRRETLCDCYLSAERDLEALIEAKDVLVMGKEDDRKLQIIFPMPPNSGKMDPDIKQLWTNVQMPRNEADLDQYLLDTNQITKDRVLAANKYNARKRGLVRKRKEKREKVKKVARLTNTHMVGKAGYGWLEKMQK